VSYKTWLISTT